MVRLGVAAVDDRVTHATVHTAHVDVGSDVPLGALLGAKLHLSEVCQALLNADVAVLALNPLHALCAQLLDRCVVGVGEAQADHLLALVVEQLEVVAGVRDGIGLDCHELQVLNNGVLVLLLLLCGVGVVEAQEHLAIVLLVGKVVVQEGGLHVSDVKVARGLRREASDDTLLGVGQANVEVGALVTLGPRGKVDGRVCGLLDEGEPSCQVGDDLVALLDQADGDLVLADELPQLDVVLGLGVSGDVRAEGQVFVELIERFGVRLGRLERLDECGGHCVLVVWVCVKKDWARTTGKQWQATSSDSSCRWNFSTPPSGTSRRL